MKYKGKKRDSNHGPSNQTLTPPLPIDKGSNILPTIELKGVIITSAPNLHNKTAQGGIGKASYPCRNNQRDSLFLTSFHVISG